MIAKLDFVSIKLPQAGRWYQCNQQQRSPSGFTPMIGCCFPSLVDIINRQPVMFKEFASDSEIMVS